MKIKPLLLASLMSALTLTAAQAQPKDTLQKIKETGTIQLGGRDASFPFSYKLSADASPIGFSADLCAKVVDAVKAKLGMPSLKVQYTIVTPTNRIALVQNGTIDLECSTTTNTVARAQQVDFAPTHFVGSIAAATKKASGLNTVAQLDGKSVATVTGSTSIQLLRAYRKNEHIQFSEVSGKDVTETFLMLSSDRAVAMILEDVQLAGGEFHGNGASKRERLFMAGNQFFGKTTAGAVEMAYHLTGLYPDWWEGKRFAQPVRALVAGEDRGLYGGRAAGAMDRLSGGDRRPRRPAGHPARLGELRRGLGDRCRQAAAARRCAHHHAKRGLCAHGYRCGYWR